MLFREHVPLAPFTTFKIGGPARWFAEAASEPDLVEAVAFARERNLPLFVLGGGSNLLVSDAGFPGLVVHVALRGIAEEDAEDGHYRIFTVGAGEDWDAFVTHVVDQGCGGIECLAGIPGTVGGTPVQNVGAYGQEVSSTIWSVRALDLEAPNPAFVELNSTQCVFSYRSSIFNTQKRGRYIVTQARYSLLRYSSPTLTYADLKRHFQGRTTPSLSEVSAAVREIRSRKGMLISPGDPDCQSAGSFFKNPIVPEATLAQLKTAAPDVPSYPAGDGLVKLPAAWLLERAGFHKGYEMGRAGVSSRHTLALINRGGASAADVIALRNQIVAAVAERFGIVLEQEPVWVD